MSDSLQTFLTPHVASLVDHLRNPFQLVVYGDKYDNKTRAVITSQDAPSSSSSGGHDAETAEFQGLFDYFCEKNCLALLVDLITGRAITPPGSDSSPPTVYLPPGSVAVQVIQTISLLVSNVKENTSLFYILSNNYINEVIEFEPWKGYGASREGGEGREEVRRTRRLRSP